MEGIARFKMAKLKPNILHYQEEGVFTSITGSSFNASREYFYNYNKGVISVFFAKNNQAAKLFHLLEFNQIQLDFPLHAKAKHICNNDTYTASYEFKNSDQFSISYVVKGPSKDYMINTLYKRAAYLLAK